MPRRKRVNPTNAIIAWATWNIICAGVTIILSLFEINDGLRAPLMVVVSLSATFILAAPALWIANVYMWFDLGEERSINFTFLTALISLIILMHFFRSLMTWWIIVGYIAGTVLTLFLRNISVLNVTQHEK